MRCRLDLSITAAKALSGVSEISPSRPFDDLIGWLAVHSFLSQICSTSLSSLSYLSVLSASSSLQIALAIKTISLYDNQSLHTASSS